jgi:GT2 family glycosyltransferase
MSSVEVLVVSFNTRDVLRDCLASLPGEVTVAVYDNASADGSAEMVETEFPRVRLVRGLKNIGFARANNFLVRGSCADHVMLLNSDTVWPSADLVGPLMGVLESDPHVAVVGPRLEGIEGEAQYSSERFPGFSFEAARALRGTKLALALRRLWDADALLTRARHVADIDACHTHDTDFLWATCWLMRRDDVVDGVFDEHFVTYDEDLDFCRRMRAAGRRVVWVGSVSLTHLGGASSAAASKRALERRGRTRYYRRHGGAATALAHSAVVRFADGARAVGRTVRRAA